MYHFVYKITNILNKKFYIGKHSTENLDDGYMGSGVVIRNAIKKYGKENFTKEIIKFFDSDQTAYEFEYEITEGIEKDKNSYNQRRGGVGIQKGTVMSEETKEKMRNKVITQKTKDKISDGHKKIIYQYSLKGEFLNKYNSANDAAEFVGKKDATHITRTARGIQYTAFKFIWSYVNDDITIKNVIKNIKESKEKIKNSNKKPVYQFTLSGEYIRKFDSGKEAGEFYNRNGSYISYSIKNNKKVFGYFWSHKKNYFSFPHV